MKKIQFLVIFLIFFCLKGQCQDDHNGIQTYRKYVNAGLNYNDSVKSSRFFYSYVKETLDKRQRSRVLIKNFLRPAFYTEFDQHGMLKKQILFSGKGDFADAPVDSSKADVYEFDERDRILKLNFNLRNPQMYPVYINEKININYILNGGGEDKFIFNYIYIYKYNDLGNVFEEFSYLISGDKSEEITDKDLRTKIIYEYDIKNRLSKQKLFAGQYGRELGNFTKMSTTIGLCDDAHLSYKYDDKDRVIETSLNCGTTVVQKDEYIYHPEKNYVVTIKRFIIDPSMAGYYKQNTVLHYNEHGDMIEINHINNPRESWDKQPEYTTTWDGGPLTMKYDYEYDRHNNWIKCRMYLEENKDEPTIIAERVIEYYDNSKK